MIGLDPCFYGTHSLRRTKATLIYKKTGNLRVVQLLLGHTKVESTVRYLGIEVDDELTVAEQIARGGHFHRWGVAVPEFQRRDWCRLLDQRQVRSRFFAALARDLIVDLLSLLERAEASPLQRAHVHEHVLATIAGLDKSETLLGIEPFDSSSSHFGLLDTPDTI